MLTSKLMIAHLLVLCYVNIARCATSSSRCLKIGSFNVKWFNVRKSLDPNIMEVLTNIIQRYDVMLMMEIRDDVDQTAMMNLWSLVNSTSPFGLTLSDRLGRHQSRYTEQYGFFYRLSKAYLVDTFQYDDSLNDEFEREPFAILIKPSRRSVRPPTAFIGVHIQPKAVATEMSSMLNVTNTIQQHWNTDRVVIMGDMNADCTFISRKELARTPLRTEPVFKWLIPDTSDSTVSDSTDCAYDHIIVTDTIVSREASVFNFKTVYALTHEEAMAVSDHFPVEAVIC